MYGYSGWEDAGGVIVDGGWGMLMWGICVWG